MDKNLKKIIIRTKKAVFSQQLGNNTSKFKGEGYDFTELREYENGEDIRKIDWVISAKMNKPYVKVFHVQRELNINIVPILTGSTYFGTVKLKKDMISEVCAYLGYITASQGDSYTSYIVNEEININTKISKKISGVERMTEKIYNYNSIGKNIDYSTLSTSLHNNLHKKSIMFLIGDFFNSKSLNLNIVAKKHEVIVLIIRDKFEENPKQMGNVNFTDPSTSQVFEGNINSSLLQNYTEKVKENDQNLYRTLKKLNINYIKIYTDDNIVKKLTELFR